MIKLIAEILISAAFAYFVSGKARDSLTPWALAVILGSSAMSPYMHPGLFSFFVFANFFSSCFVTNGYKLRYLVRNPVLCLFLLFWGWQCLSMCFGEYVSYSVVYFLQIPFESISLGYFVAFWAMQKPENWDKLMKAITIVLAVVVLVYLKEGAFSERMGYEETFRSALGLDEENSANPNWVGLVIIGILPYSVLSLLRAVSKKDMKHGVLAFVVASMLALALVRTGSRNACLGLIPLVLYSVFNGTRLSFVKRITTVVVLFTVLVLLIGKTTSSVSDLRLFSISKTGDISSGRFDHFRYKMLYHLSPKERWFGCGAWLDYPMEGQIKLANGHSVPVQILRQSGYVGMGLFLIFSLALVRRCLRCGPQGRLALTLFCVWLFTGVGESGPLLSGGGGSKILLGMAIALCSHLSPCVQDFSRQFNPRRILPSDRPNMLF